jgi:hypothetical protein
LCLLKRKPHLRTAAIAIARRRIPCWSHSDDQLDHVGDSTQVVVRPFLDLRQAVAGGVVVHMKPLRSDSTQRRTRRDDQLVRDLRDGAAATEGERHSLQ